MSNKRILLYIVCVFWCVLGFPLFAQTGASVSVQEPQVEEIVTTRQTSNAGTSLNVPSADASSNIMLARSSADYLVTPGDVYTLAYAAGSAPVSYTITVDTSYRIRVSNLGIINGAGKTFMQLKREVETAVANNYPLSGVQLVLTQPAIFRVKITGEVSTSGEVSAWALARLSSLVGNYLTPYASTRDITIQSAAGRSRVYDLFKAQRFGDLSEDPYLRPGDIVTFNKIKRVVTISGAVERPGAYQLLEGENLKQLIQYYGNGFTTVADKTRATLTRYVDSTEISGDVIHLSATELTGDYVLRDMDTITVPTITALRPAVPVDRIERTITIEGAVRRPGTYVLMPNENMKELIEVYADGFTPVADKTRASLTRFVGSAEISGDVTMLSEQELAGNYALRHMDVVRIPDITELRPAVHVNRLERMITISGAVRRPGTYELMPNENLKELIEVYADGFNALADDSRLELVRLINSADIAGNKIFLTEDDIENNFPLEHFDSITVPDVTTLQAVMFVEGAIGIDLTAELTTTNRMTVQFPSGETYASLVRRNTGWFTAVSDTQNAYIIRGDEHIPINLNPVLYDAAYRGMVQVENYDTLVIPFRQYFVTVAGAVQNPGRYPYIPDRNWEYYIGLAGGFIQERNAAKQVSITSLTGERMRKTDAISPETVITAGTNHFLYYFNQYAPVVTTILTLITTIFTVQAVISR